MVSNRFPSYGYFGLISILLAEIGLWQDWWFFEIYMTPVCWTGLILFLDALNFYLSANSLIMTRRREFLLMLPWSILLWYFFEFYNLFLQNWHYVGLPENRWLRYSGYFWSFATIWPGVLEIFDLIRNMNLLGNVRLRPVQLTKRKLIISFTTGLLCMLLPFVVSPETATYLAAPVWIGMVFMLDPLNWHWGRHSLWRDWSRGDMSTLFQLFLAGLIAGGLWEFWNYWATAKWIYTVPILGEVKIFEMPVVGYLGFPAFAVEIFVMWETVKYFMKIDRST